MRFIIFLALLSSSIFSFRWIYERGEGTALTTECPLMKKRWEEKMTTAKTQLEKAPANVRLFLFDLLTEKDYSIENCSPITALEIDQVFRRAGQAYQNDPGNFQSFEHYRAEVISRMDALDFYSLKGALLSEADYWEVSFRKALYLGNGPFQFANDFGRRVALAQSALSFFLLLILFLPATKRVRR